jgi:aspartate/methionine/tyrosine aminotransferase
MSPSSSSRAALVQPFIVMDMFREANALAAVGHDVVHMSAGQPAGGPPKKVVEAAREALDGAYMGYTNSLGLPALRERIARHYHDAYGVDVDSGRVVVTTGSSGAFVLSFLACFDQGDKVGLTVPGYPAYSNILTALDITVADIEVDARHRWAPTPEQISTACEDGLSGLLLASPANPTGTMVSPDNLAAISRTCANKDIWFISDEIYHGLNYEMPQATALSSNSDAIIINSFSKYYCMTGWRIGWMIVPESLVRPVECLAQSLFISPPTISQYAAVAAFDATDELEQRKAQYRENRDFLLRELPALGLGNLSPADGAFYLYADVANLTNDSFAFAQAMLKQAHVAVSPGADFDADRGNRFLRLSFAGSMECMEKAVERLSRWLPKSG